MNTNHLENDASNYDDADKNATGDAFEYNMFTDDSFMAQVWNKTLGEHCLLYFNLIQIMITLTNSVLLNLIWIH